MLKVADISRLRMKTDGDGIRTLVLLRGCPLRCRYCINPDLRSRKGDARDLSAKQLYEEIFPDRPYFMATGGGVTFGGGEPLLFAKDIAAFRALTEGAFTVFVETSLHVPERMVKAAAGSIDRFYVDIKTTDAKKYRAYTQGRLQTVLRNLELLLSEVGSERVVVRIPEIPGFTTTEEQLASKERLEAMGVHKFDLFTYRLTEEKAAGER